MQPNKVKNIYPFSCRENLLSKQKDEEKNERKKSFIYLLIYLVQQKGEKKFYLFLNLFSSTKNEKRVLPRSLNLTSSTKNEKRVLPRSFNLSCSTKKQKRDFTYFSIYLVQQKRKKYYIYLVQLISSHRHSLTLTLSLDRMFL